MIQISSFTIASDILLEENYLSYFTTISVVAIILVLLVELNFILSAYSLV